MRIDSHTYMGLDRRIIEKFIRSNGRLEFGFKPYFSQILILGNCSNGALDRKQNANNLMQDGFCLYSLTYENLYLFYISKTKIMVL